VARPRVPAGRRFYRSAGADLDVVPPGDLKQLLCDLGAPHHVAGHGCDGPQVDAWVPQSERKRQSVVDVGPDVCVQYQGQRHAATLPAGCGGSPDL